MCVGGVSAGIVCERERQEVGSAASDSLKNRTFV